jgi:K+-sensing histidine kinase KdpD
MVNDMQRPLSVLSPVDEQESHNWRTLALSIAALLAQMPEQQDGVPEQQDGVLNVVARQLKAPVANLRAHAARLEEQAANLTEPEIAREVASRIVEQADLMAEWVAAILDIQRIRLGKMQLARARLDLVRLARACIDELGNVGDTEIRFVRLGSPSEPVVADSERLNQVLNGVLRRAAKHAAGHPIELRVTRRRLADGQPHAVVIVAEAGHDVSESEMQRILGGQRGLDQDLDLYVGREIMRLHGGELGIDSAATRSGVAILVLPVDISHRSHAVLARGRPCSSIRLAR